MTRVFILMLGLCSPLFAQATPPSSPLDREVEARKQGGTASEAPLFAQMQTHEFVAGQETHNGDSVSVVPWLHVEVETKYTWISQTSIARCWTTKSRDDTTRVNVGQLCLMLDAHWTHKTCDTDTCYLEIKEVRRRLAVPKATATVTAWSESPHIEQTSVKMAP